MKQILIVILATALVVGGFVFMRDSGDGKKQNRQRAAGSGVSAPAGRRPDVRTGDARGTKVRQMEGDGKVTIKTTPEAERNAELLRKALDRPWKDTLTDETLIPIEEAWDVDLTKVDFDQETIWQNSDGSVTVPRSEFERFACWYRGRQIIEAIMLNKWGRSISARFDQEFAFTDEQWERFLAAAAKDGGISVEDYIRNFSIAYELDTEAALFARRLQIEAILNYYPLVETVDQLPGEVMTVMQDEEDRLFLNFTMNALADAREDLDAEGKIERLANGLEGLMQLFGHTMFTEHFRRSWSFFDGNMPADCVAGYALGELITNEDVPPWLQPGGELGFVKTEEVWPHVERILRPSEKQAILRELIWYRALAQALESKGNMQSAEDSWLDFAYDYRTSQFTLLSLQVAIFELYGFQSVPLYRQGMRIFNSFVATLPENWDDEDKLREFYHKHRFFIQGWSTAVEIILIPPTSILEDSLTVDWEKARQRAVAMRERIDAGEDFSTIRLQHHKLLLDKYRELLGDAVASDFEMRFKAGKLGDSINAQQQLLKETLSQKMLNPASVIRNAAVRLEKGEVSPVWKSPIGYVLIKLNNAGVATLDSEFEDFRDKTIEEYKWTHFGLWTQECLSKLN